MNEKGACVLGGRGLGGGRGESWEALGVVELITHFPCIPECTAIQHDVLSTGLTFLDYFIEKYDTAWVE